MLVLKFLIIILAAYLICGGILYFRQPSILYQPLRQVDYTPQQINLDFENVDLQTSDGLKLAGWYIPVKKSAFTILFCHGNGGNIMHRLDSINIFNDLGLNCFIFDYRGYGNSQGKPTEKGTYLDAQAAYTWLTDVKKIPPDNIIIFGRSIGGCIAAQLATKVNAKALAVESCFTSFVDVGKKFYPYMPIRLFARFNYNTIDHIKKVTCPTMIIHSRDDEMIPFEFGTMLFEASNEPKKFVEISGGHNDAFLISGKIYRQAWFDWLKFLKQHQNQRSSPVL